MKTNFGQLKMEKENVINPLIAFKNILAATKPIL